MDRACNTEGTEEKLKMHTKEMIFCERDKGLSGRMRVGCVYDLL